MAHEQLVFEDNGETINIGYGSEGMIENEDMTGYVPKEKSGYYNDCVMHTAVANVKPKPYSMIGLVILITSGRLLTFRCKVKCVACLARFSPTRSNISEILAVQRQSIAGDMIT